MLRYTVIAIISLVSSLTYAKEGIVRACIDDHPPYQVLADEPYGSHIDALKVMANVLNKKLAYVRSPNFARCVVMLRNGEVDVVAGLGKTPEREKFAFYTPFKPADALKVISKKSITINKYEDFTGKIIGVSRGTMYFSRFDNDRSLNKISIQNERVGLSLLLKNRIDLMMTSPVLLESLSTEISNANLKISPIELDELRAKETPFGFSRKHQLNMSNEEIIEKIRTAYLSGQFQPQ
jgi:polar amino acid transport system substrate-binding protein